MFESHDLTSACTFWWQEAGWFPSCNHSYLCVASSASENEEGLFLGKAESTCGVEWGWTEEELSVHLLPLYSMWPGTLGSTSRKRKRLQSCQCLVNPLSILVITPRQTFSVLQKHRMRKDCSLQIQNWIIHSFVFLCRGHAQHYNSATWLCRLTLWSSVSGYFCGFSFRFVVVQGALCMQFSLPEQ